MANIPNLDQRLALHKPTLDLLHDVWNQLAQKENALEWTIINTPEGNEPNPQREDMIRVHRLVREARRSIRSTIDSVVYPRD